MKAVYILFRHENANDDWQHSRIFLFESRSWFILACLVVKVFRSDESLLSIPPTLGRGWPTREKRPGGEETTMAKLSAEEWRAYRSGLDKMIRTNPTLARAAEEEDEQQRRRQQAALSGNRKRKEGGGEEEGVVLFSRLAFEDDTGNGAGRGMVKHKKRKHMFSSDPKQALAKVTQQRSILEGLRRTDPEKAHALEEKDAWTKAICKASGVVVHDDPVRLKKAVKRREKKKERGQKRWDELKTQVKDEQAARQTKRAENIAARKETKKQKKRGRK